MSVEAMSWALSQPLGGHAKVVLIGIANHARPDGKGAWPSASTLTKYAHCSHRTVQRYIVQLEAEGWIVRAGTHVPDGRADKATVVWDLPLATVRHPDASVTERYDNPDTSGTTNGTDRYDTTVSYKPSLNRPTENQPPLPPAPRGERERDRGLWENEHLLPFCAEHFPSAPCNLVAHFAAEIRSVGEEPTVDRLRPLVQQYAPSEDPAA